MNRRLLAIPVLLVCFVATAAARGNREPSFLIEVEDLVDMMSKSDVILLDVRDEASFLKGHIPGAALLPLSAVEKAAAELAEFDVPVITYCSCPAEESSMNAALTLRSRGVGRIHVLRGGYPAWTKAGNAVREGSSG